jgi:apolipoprotein N-acyltransferase
MKSVAYIGLCGSVGLFLGFPNPFVHLPALALVYPASLALLGESASKPASALRRGWLTGLAGASAALYWLAVPVYEVGGLPWVLAVPCALAIGAYVGL